MEERVDSRNNKIVGVLNAYRRILPEIKFGSPTNFAPIIRHFTMMARSFPNLQDNYFIIYILTSGAISDMKQTEEVSIGIFTWNAEVGSLACYMHVNIAVCIEEWVTILKRALCEVKIPGALRFFSIIYKYFTYSRPCP